ncbi:protein DETOXIFICATION 46, chloroplastic-like [Cornus florida]|uniref:protein DETOXIFICATION 46, chloroplastic-like n=1 Tax=Cornus florida TaxID=4283 RepID=UPI00289D4806|nr:protein DETOXIFICATION 46, chloroplastic-like [Cornus florida]
MYLKTLSHHCHLSIQTHKFKQLSTPPTFFNKIHLHSPSKLPSTIRISPVKYNNRSSRLITGCISPSQELLSEDPEIASEIVESNGSIPSIQEDEEENSTARTEVIASKREEFAEDQSIWNQMVEIVKFSGPATGLWICGPLMSLIDTAVIGQGSSVELAALGPGTVLCDNMSYVFMFLSIATSNMVATSLAKGDKKEVQHQISILLCVGLACGVLMLLFMRFCGAWALTGFAGPKNIHIVPAANKYVQIRGLAWPAVLVGWVAQSASLGMKDSWGPLKALAVASTVNIIGHVVLCSYLGYGIAGAAWATMVSQVIAACMMVQALNNKGYNGFAISIPSPTELLQILTLAAPVFLTISSKVAFYSLIIYFATSMGTATVGAHQVMIQMYSMCVVWGEPLSQTAQSFMPELIYGANRSLEKARMLLKSLVIIGAMLGLVLGTIGTCVPWLFPRIFTSDASVIHQMHGVLIPFFIALCITPCTHSLEGTLLAGRDLKFISLTMSGCFSLGSLLLLLVSSRGYGLLGCWCALVGFQWARFFFSLRRLISPEGVLYSEDLTQYRMEKLKAA